MSNVHSFFDVARSVGEAENDSLLLINEMFVINNDVDKLWLLNKNKMLLKAIITLVSCSSFCESVCIAVIF